MCEAGSPVSAFSLHPGEIHTPLVRHSFLAGWGAYLGTRVGFLKTPQQGAATSIYAAVTPGLEAASGAYLVDCSLCEEGCSSAGKDLGMARALWDKTEELIGEAMAAAMG
jgi:hypothetical protein